MAESTSAQQQKAANERRAAATGAAAAAGGGAAVGIAPGAAGTAAAGSGAKEILSSAKRAAILAAVLAAITAFLTVLRSRSESFLRDLLQSRGPLDDVEAVMREERDREQAFADGVRSRIERDLPRALALESQELRDAAVRALLQREKRYAQQRVQAMSARMVAAMDRRTLRRTSPRGAFWELDPGVKEHTAGCLVMGNKFWPWKVLDRVHPPRHFGCPCKLRGEGYALKNGLMRAGDVLDVAAAVRAAAGVVMEAEEVEALATELERDAVIEALVAQGLASREDLNALAEVGGSDGGTV